MTKRLIGAGFLVVLAAMAAPAQSRVDEKCSGKIYGAREVTRRGRILKPADVSIVTRVDPNVRGTVVLEAVLCRTGRVTDIRVIKGLSATVNEFIAAALTMVRFVPAELRWHSVSQRMNFEFNFGGNELGIKFTTSADATGRLVETVDIIGHRRLTTEQIFSWIKTRPGEPYRQEQLERDLKAILDTGNFDKTQTRVTLEDGVRGGVVITFEVVELSLIADIKFDGLKIDRSLVLDAWKKEQINLQPGGTYDVAAIRAATRVLKQVLDANGQSNSRVEIRTEHPTSMVANLTFVITPSQ